LTVPVHGQARKANLDLEGHYNRNGKSVNAGSRKNVMPSRPRPAAAASFATVLSNVREKGTLVCSVADAFGSLPHATGIAKFLVFFLENGGTRG
jgi:hypothetical protein